MAITDFTNMGATKKTAFEEELLRMSRNKSFIKQFAGNSDNSVVHICDELKKTNKGTEQASIRLVGEYDSDGIVGDNQAEDNEGSFSHYEQLISFDQLRLPVRSKGKLSDQKSVDDFRRTALNQLSYAMANKQDELASLTLSGVSYDRQTNGALRPAESQLPQLDFASSVTAPTANRHFRWNAGAGTLDAGNTAAVTATDTPSYKMIVEAKARFREEYMRCVNEDKGQESIHIFMNPTGIAKLKLDADYLANLRGAGQRGQGNQLFKGTGSMLMADGAWVHDWRLVYNTRGLTSGVDKWGAGSNVEGQRVLVCGAQALAMADIGKPEWVEKEFDYDNNMGISVGKMFGFLKTVFKSEYSGQKEDFGVMCIDTAI